jgi:phenylacetate-CoA ligase
VQYDPHTRFFEVNEGDAGPTLVLTCDGPAPLVRYHLSDRGGLFEYAALLERLREYGVDPFEEVERDDPSVVALPFVYVFGRSHNAVSFYGANVFPEMVSVGLEQTGIAERVSGKFVMMVREDRDKDSHFHVVVEMAAGEGHEGADGHAIADAIAGSIGLHVARLSSEYRTYVPAERHTPRVELRSAGDPEYFPSG